MQEVIPAHLLIYSSREAFLGWLRGLPVDEGDKKQLLMYWSDRVGVGMTEDMIKKAGIE